MLYSGISAARRARWHRRAGEVIEAAAGEDPSGEHLRELAHHWTEATRPQDVDKAIDYARRAGDLAYDALASGEARRWYQRALDLLDAQHPDDARTRAAILARIGTAAQEDNDTALGRELLIEAGRLARAAGDDATVVRAAAGLRRGRYGGLAQQVGTFDAEAVALLEAALDTLGEDAPERAQLLSLLAIELDWHDTDRAFASMLESRALVRRLDDPTTMAVLLSNAYQRHPDDFDDGRAFVEEATATLQGSADPTLHWNLLYSGFLLALDVGDRDRFDATQAGFEWYRDSGVGSTLWTDRLGVMVNLVQGAFIRGDLEEAASHSDASLQLALDAGQPEALAFYGGQMRMLRTAQGRFDEIVDMLRQVAADNVGVPAFRAGFAAGLCSIGEDEEAAAVIADDLADGFASVPRNGSWIATLVLGAEVVAHLGLEEPAAALYDLLAPYSGRMAMTGITIYESVDHFLGLLAVTLGRYDDAVGHFAAAQAIHDGFRAPYFQARTALAWASALVARDADGDRAEARRLLDDALRHCDGRGFALVEERARALSSSLAPDV